MDLNCLCGAKADGIVPDAATARRISERWAMGHSGPGHGPCTHDEAERARVKEDIKTETLLEGHELADEEVDAIMRSEEE